jgi:flagellum-specific peptidoglycan hydrolase FlgJ
MMAQAILESSDANGVPGNSNLALKHNNFFGIKASNGWSGDTVQLQTHEIVKGVSVLVNASFRAYPTVNDSILDHVDFLEKNPRYRTAGVFDAKTPSDQALRLQKAGYSTNPNYPAILVKLINDNNLLELDKEGEVQKKSESNS